jgi:nitrate/TMAO reductase-like tetraheme cytochrome c subunit
MGLFRQSPEVQSVARDKNGQIHVSHRGHKATINKKAAPRDAQQSAQKAAIDSIGEVEFRRRVEAAKRVLNRVGRDRILDEQR